jgi:uncharacterized protein involved in tolerance to divalent cations
LWLLSTHLLGCTDDYFFTTKSECQWEAEWQGKSESYLHFRTVSSTFVANLQKFSGFHTYANEKELNTEGEIRN